jgi:hypothetical protein
MAMALVKIRIQKPLSVLGVKSSTIGWSRQIFFKNCMGMGKEHKESTTILQSVALPILEHGFLDEICLVPFVVSGRKTVGKDGGERIHHIIVQYLF